MKMKWFDCISIFLIISFFPSYALANVDEPNLGWLAILIGIVIMFFVLREVQCWFWKINERNYLLVEILEEEKKQTVILKSLNHV